MSPEAPGLVLGVLRAPAAAADHAGGAGLQLE